MTKRYWCLIFAITWLAFWVIWRQPHSLIISNVFVAAMYILAQIEDATQKQ